MNFRENSKRPLIPSLIFGKSYYKFFSQKTRLKALQKGPKFAIWIFVLKMTRPLELFPKIHRIWYLHSSLSDCWMQLQNYISLINWTSVKDKVHEYKYCIHSSAITDISDILKVSLIEKPFIRELHQTVHFSRWDDWYGDLNFGHHDVFLKTEIIKWQWKQQWLWSWPFFSKPSGTAAKWCLLKILWSFW